MVMPLTPRLMEIVVHDLRNSLNVINLTLRMIDELSNPQVSGLAEDLEALRSHVAETDRMLVQITEFCQLGAPNGLRIMPFDLRGLLASLVGEYAGRYPGAAIRLEAPAGPSEVMLDPDRAQSALRRVLDNARAAAEGQPIRLQFDESADRRLIRVTIEGPPRATVQPGPLQADGFEHLTGTPHERRSLGLAIAARISELFGGSARLEVEPAKSSTIVLDWPRTVS